MARRAKPHEEELPFVALMDTMTNVVGVLIIVLVMIGIGLAKSVQKVLSELPMVSEVEHDQLKEALGEFDSKRDPVEVDAEIAKLKESLQKTLEAMKPLEAAEAKDPVVLEDLAALMKKLEAAKKEREQRKMATEQMLAQIDQLKIKLDTTPPFVAPPPIAVRLPNSRPMPEKAELKRVLVSEGRLMFLKNEEFLDALEEEFKKENTSYTVRSQVIKDANGKPSVKKGRNGQNVVQKTIYFDPVKLTKFFSKGQFGNRDLRVDVAQSPNSPNLQMKILPKPNGGETPEQVRKGNSTFRYELAQLKTDSKSVVWFLVCKDSIGAYLGARDVVDAEGIPAGWELYDAPSYSQAIPPTYQADFTPAPAAPAPAGAAAAAKPAGPPPVRIAPPKAALD